MHGSIRKFVNLKEDTMAIVNTSLNSNILANLNNLRLTDYKIQQTIEKLSTGLRITYASDDPSGLAIANRFETQIRGLRQATINAEQTSSLVQTAYSVLSETDELLLRMRDLALKVMNQATLTTANIATLDTEFDSLRDEITRKGEAATFNTKKILDGTFASPGQVAQIGAGAGIQLSIIIESMVAGTIANATNMLINVQLTSDIVNSSMGHAASALSVLDTSLEYLGTVQSSLGVQEYRLNSIVNDLTAQEINTVAAKSNITDVDMAAEISIFARLQILSQAGTAVMAHQSNNIQERIVSLLENL
jgi:flagellin